MTNIFYRIFVFSQKHKALFFSAFFIFMGLALFLASKIQLEENISSVIPQDEKVARINKAFEGFKISGRLVLHVYSEDTATADPQRLIKAAHEFSDSLQNRYGPYIQEVKLEFPDTQIDKLYTYYYQNLPFYLEEEDYHQIAERTSPEGLETTLIKNYKSLMSPVGLVTKKMLVRDPFSLVSFPLLRANSLRGDENIELYQNHLLTKDRQHLIFFLALSNPPNETANNGALIEGMDRLIQRFREKDPDLHIEYFGQTAVSVANAERIKKDITLTVSIAVIGLFLFISFFYRNIAIFFLAVTPGLFGAVVAIALLAMIKGNVSVISLGVGSVLLGITIDYALHLFTHYKHQRNIPLIFSDISGPLLMSSGTTACAFFSLLFIRSEALADLGLFAGTSVLASVLYTLIVLPHFIIRKDTVQSKGSSVKKNVVEKVVSALAYYPFHKAPWALGILVLLSIISLFTWRNYGFESDMLRLNYMPDKLAVYERNLNEVSTYSANSFYLVSTGATLWEALEAETKVKQKLQDLKEEGVIYSYITVQDIVPPHSFQRKRIQQWENYWKENEVDSFLVHFYDKAQKTGFQPAAFAGFEKLLRQEYSLLQEKDIADILSVFGDELIIQNADGTVSVISSVKLSAANKKAVIQEFDQQLGSLIFDKGYFTARLVELLQEDFNTLVNLSLVIVFGIILISYGRIELALIAFVPILLSWLWILGLMGLFDLKFNIVNIIICTFIFGLGIDYSIFVMRGLTQEYKLGLHHLLSYKKSILLSAVTTLTSIGVLAFAEHPALKSIALLAIIGILSVIFLTFTIQPVLYHLFILGRKKKGVVPYTLLSLCLSVFAFLYFLLGCALLLLFRLILFLPLAPEKKKKLFYHWLMMLFSRSLIYIMANVKKDIIGREQANFHKPSVIISNHHSFLDIMLLLMFHPKLVMVTNDWVYHSPFFGHAVQFADFILASKGLENQLEKIQMLVKEGYSIIVFPEGSRSETAELRRFHKGAFYLASALQLDIQPIMLHGTHYVMPKEDGFHLKSGTVTVKFLPRIQFGDEPFGTTHSELAKGVSKYFKEAYQKLRAEKEVPGYFGELITKNYIYKGPVLEWYLRVKFRLERGYRLFHELLPKKGRIVDLGCGYGFMTYALALSGEKRELFGIDYDSEKIEVAKNCPVKPINLRFDHGDVTTYPFGKADAFVISDVLHYLLPEEQLKVLSNMVQNLREGGKIIIRDGDSSKQERHKGTKLTEVFSTGTGFNKTKNQLYFISSDMIRTFAKENNLELEIIDQTKLTSNTVFVLKQKSKNGEI